MLGAAIPIVAKGRIYAESQSSAMSAILAQKNLKKELERRMRMNRQQIISELRQIAGYSRSKATVCREAADLLERDRDKKPVKCRDCTLWSESNRVAYDGSRLCKFSGCFTAGHEYCYHGSRKDG